MPAKTTTTRVRIGRVGPRRQVVIPREILKTLKLREGDFVAISKQQNGVLIRPKHMAGSDEVLTPGEAKKVRHAIKQVRSGKTKRWDQVKDELGL
ncbi:MAG: AbrB/MazE/SpoVT family DNA-binding domain-containing protein [Acidobacteriia bacterium]|nr:AbrB/MazE/SpoVT family DNA-binding domain-containing protein [Terriglobia bacterium]